MEALSSAECINADIVIKTNSLRPTWKEIVKFGMPSQSYQASKNQSVDYIAK